MSGNFHLPPVGFGPGSQPVEDGELEYMEMPQDMRTFSPRVPDLPEGAQVSGALALLERLSQACSAAATGARPAPFYLAALAPAEQALVAECMGTGEVSLKMGGIPAIAAQETIFAGVWWLKGAGVDRIEVAPIPALALERAFTPTRAPMGAAAPRDATVVNAPPLLAELLDKSAAWQPGAEVHVVNLSLLPHTEGDLAWLDAAFGQGSVTALSRGYGNCRVTATGTPHVWRVQFFNSMDTLILDTFEVTECPEVVIAATEDLQDSARRLLDVLEAIR